MRSWAKGKSSYPHTQRGILIKEWSNCQILYNIPPLNDRIDNSRIINELINKLPDYTDFIKSALYVFIILVPLQYGDLNISFDEIIITDKKTNKTITLNVNSKIIVYNNTTPHIIYELENYNSNNYDTIILDSYEYFNFYHQQYLKYLNKKNNL